MKARLKPNGVSPSDTSEVNKGYNGSDLPVVLKEAWKEVELEVSGSQFI